MAMAEGMIAQNMAGGMGGPSSDLSSDKVAEGIKMPPELKEAYERVVIAGMKVMFSKESHKFFIEQLQAEGQMAEKLGKGVAGLVMFLYKESNQTIPSEVLIPAGVRLLTKASDFINQSGNAQVSNEEIGNAMQLMVETIMTQFGISPEQMDQVLAKQGGQNIPSNGAQAPAQPADQQPMQQPAQPTGVSV